MKKPISPRIVLMVLSLLITTGLWYCRPYTPAPYPTGEPASPEIDPTLRPYEVFGRHYTPLASADGFRETGVASWYGDPFHGQHTANGEIYNMHAKTAAHRTLPMGTFLMVRNIENNREILVRINDRGPFAKDRIIDLSYRSALDIDMVRNGTAQVELRVVNPEDPGIRDRIMASYADFYTGEFSVQVGSYAELKTAESLRERLLKEGQEASISTGTVDGRPVYRVRVGRFADRKNAQNVKHILTDKGYQQAFIVRSGL